MSSSRSFQTPAARRSNWTRTTADSSMKYEVELVTADGQKKALHVNATTGQVEKIEHD